MNINWALKKNQCSLSFRVAKAHDNIHCYTITHTHSEQRLYRSDFSACCIASDEPAQIREIMIHNVK